MDDGRVWAFEESLWTEGEENYRAKIDPACLMALPAEPFLFDSEAAIRAVSNTPRWSHVRFEGQRVGRPEEGLIVIAYTVHAERGGEHYTAHCSTTMRRLGHDDWKVVQHSQSIAPVVTALKG